MITLFLVLSTCAFGVFAVYYRVLYLRTEMMFEQVLVTAQAFAKRELELRRALTSAARWLEDATDVIDNAGVCMEEEGEVEEARAKIVEFRREAST